MLQINSLVAHRIIEDYANKEIKRKEAIKRLRELGCSYYDARELTEPVIIFQQGPVLSGLTAMLDGDWEDRDNQENYI